MKILNKLGDRFNRWIANRVTDVIMGIHKREEDILRTRRGDTQILAERLEKVEAKKGGKK